MDLGREYREYLLKLERELVKFIATGQKGALMINRKFDQLKKEQIERLREIIFIAARTASEELKTDMNILAEPILSGFTHYADEIDSEVKRILRKGLPTTETKNNIKKAIDAKEHIARTLALTGTAGINQVKRISDALDAGFKYFKYIGAAPERKFCKIHYNKIYTVEEILKLDNGTGRKGKTPLPPLYFGGGYNCRHIFAPVIKADEKPKPLPPEVKPKRRSGRRRTTKEKPINVSGSAVNRPAFYDKLSEGQKEAFDAIFSKAGFIFREDFYKDDFENGLKVVEHSKGSYCYRNEIFIDKRKTEENKKRVYIHEAGHARHNTQRLIVTATNSVNPEILKSFKDFQKTVNQMIKETEEGTSINYLNRSYSKWFELEKKVTGAGKLEEFMKATGIGLEEAADLALSTADFFGALTKNRIGYGHSNRYYKNISMQAAEWFAHCMENYYYGNAYFERTFPDLYKKTLEFMKGLSNVKI